MQIALAATSQSIDIRVVDDSGLPVTGLVAATMPTLKYSLAGPNADVTITPVDLALLTTAWASGGVKERDGGRYRLDMPNAAFTTQGRITVSGEDTDKRVICPTIDVGMLVAGAIYVYPVSATYYGDVLRDAAPIIAYQHRRFGPYTFQVTDANGADVDLTSDDLVFVACDPHTGAVLFRLTQADGEISVANTNEVTIDAGADSTVTADAVAEFKWLVSDVTTGLPRLKCETPLSEIKAYADVASA